MAKTTLEALFEFCNIDQEYIDYAKKSLYKYKDDPIVNLVCNIITENLVQHNKLRQLFIEANSDFWHSYDPKVYPLIIPSPNSPLELRVYPNIIIDDHITLDGISSSYCNTQLKTFLTEYEADIADEKRKQKWVPQDRAEKRLLEFVDMPTARALQRYVFSNSNLKDHEVRNFAEAVDSCRKPMELIFTEKPEDFHTMYATGPHSCMAMSAAERANWEFLKKEGLAPTSWYHWCDFTTGVYAVKNGKVIARTVLFKGQKSKNWEWVRIYATNDEIRRKFLSSLEEIGIKQCVKAEIPTGYNFTVPGIKKGSVYAAPWAYLDSPLPSPHTTGQSWNVQYNTKDHSFTYHFHNDKFDRVNSRSGHIISSDYSIMECTSCGKVIKKQDRVVNIRIEHDYHIFCSDNCAANEGFVKVMDGLGQQTYKLLDNSMIDVAFNPIAKFSTLKAAYDCGYVPLIEEVGIFPEDTDIKVLSLGSSAYKIKDTMGKVYTIQATNLETGIDFNARSYIPYRMLTSKKVVSYSEDNLFTNADNIPF